MHHPPHPSAPQPTPSVTCFPSTPSTANGFTSLSANAGAFVPTKEVSNKNASRQEVTLDTLKRAPLTTIPPRPHSLTSVKTDIKRQSIWIESQEQKAKGLAEERAKEGESDNKSKSSDALVRANEAAARREVERQESLKEQQRKLQPLDIIELEPIEHVSRYP